VALPYPAAGTDNAEVGLHVVDLAGRRVEVVWDRAAFPYLAAVSWEGDGPLTLLVQARDQTAAQVLAAAPGSAPPAPPPCDPRRLTVDGRPVTPPGLQVAAVVAATGGTVLVAGSEE